MHTTFDKTKVCDTQSFDSDLKVSRVTDLSKVLTILFPGSESVLKNVLDFDCKVGTLLEFTFVPRCL